VNPVYEAALEIQRFCDEAQWRFCFIGGVAIQRWGEPRFTHDADLTLLTGFGQETRYIDRLLGHFEGRIPDPGGFALRSRVLLLTAANGIPIDISLGGLPFEERLVVERASAWEAASEITLRTCGAEDLIILKAFAGRDGDWRDLDGVVARQSGKLDTDLIFRELAPLLELKEDAETEQRLRKLLLRT
jgi:hypothetical protein